jgi:4-hydroxybenzoate polyprenyltransferase
MWGYLRLVRISNLPTAISNILAGWLVVNAAWSPPLVVVALVVGSALIYMAGMVLNDWFDRQTDRDERPERPIPTGKVSAGAALWLGIALLFSGWAVLLITALALAPAASCTGGERLAGSASLLVVMVVAYDAVVKRTIAGPLVMGACRSLNYLVAMSLLAPASPVAVVVADGDAWWGLPRGCWAIAAGVGLFVAGITTMARHESTSVRRAELVVGGLLMIAGICVLGWGCDQLLAPRDPAGFVTFVPSALLFGFLLITVLRRWLIAIAMPRPSQTQQTVVAALGSLILIDAVVCLLAVPTHPQFGIAVALLIVPAWVLRRWVAAT